MLIIHKYKCRTSHKSTYKVHTLRSNKLVSSSDILTSNTLVMLLKTLMKGHKDILITNVKTSKDLDLTTLQQIDDLI